ncbi:MAG: hypothetical protein COA82_10690 [Alkaliphilus sp.]|nr:MAG: hypothetical protein COA82_10690 [Alkaliphilus sp.]
MEKNLKTKEEKVLELMLLVLKLDKSEEFKIREVVEKIGFKTFLVSVDGVDLESETREKIIALKYILDYNNNEDVFNDK